MFGKARKSAGGVAFAHCPVTKVVYQGRHKPSKGLSAVHREGNVASYIPYSVKKKASVAPFQDFVWKVVNERSDRDLRALLPRMTR